MARICWALHFNAAFIVIADDYFPSQEGSLEKYIKFYYVLYLDCVVRANGE